MYLNVLLFFGACVVTTIIALASGVRHPTVLYILLAVAIALSVGSFIATLIEGSRANKKKAAIKDADGFDLTTTLGTSVSEPAPPMVIHTTTPEFFGPDSAGKEPRRTQIEIISKPDDQAH